MSPFEVFKNVVWVLQLSHVLSLFSAFLSLSGVFLKASIILVDIPHQKKEKKNIMLFTLNIHTAKTF